MFRFTRLTLTQVRHGFIDLGHFDSPRPRK
jgi:hypothetical protein